MQQHSCALLRAHICSVAHWQRQWQEKASESKLPVSLTHIFVHARCPATPAYNYERQSDQRGVWRDNSLASAMRVEKKNRQRRNTYLSPLSSAHAIPFLDLLALFFFNTISYSCFFRTFLVLRKEERKGKKG